MIIEIEITQATYEKVLRESSGECEQVAPNGLVIGNVEKTKVLSVLSEVPNRIGRMFVKR